MSRPSRGFTVSQPQPSSGSACPTTMLLELVILDTDDYQYHFSWSPAVMAPTLTLYGRLNGEDLGPMYVATDQTSPGYYEFDPHAWGMSGDTLTCWIVASDSVDCADWTSNEVDTVIL